MTNYLQQILTYFRNKTLNSVGATRTFQQLLLDKDIERALSMLANHDDEVDNALKEYNPQTHEVMKRPNKYRKNDMPYISEKLPRTRQKYINEVELFFLFGRPIVWKKAAGKDEMFDLFKNFLTEQHFNSRIREIKRLAGAETEAALLFHIYRQGESEQKVKSLVLARSTGYRLRPLIDQYGNMTAFGYGYKLNEGGKSVEHWDFQTSDLLVYAKHAAVGWDVEIYPNPTGKINVIYFRQEKAWEGAQQRIAREEMLDSRTADTVNYYGDPIAMATADVIDNLADPDMPGKLIQMSSQQSRFEYLQPPQAPGLRAAEKEDLKQSILFDTFTPDFDFEKIRGMGTLSGTAIKNSMILAYMKRERRIEIYEEMIARLKNLVIGILRFLNPTKGAELDELRVEFEFSEPFDSDKQSQWAAIAQLYTSGVMSLEEAVEQLAICDQPDAEIQRIKQAQQEKQAAMQAPKDVPMPANTNTDNGKHTQEATQPVRGQA